MLTFAIVESGEAFDPILHRREDLTVFSLRISQSGDGGFAVADMQVLNERVPLPGKRVLIAEDGVLLLDGYVTTSRGQIGAIIDLEVLAKPLNADARLATLCTSLKTKPHYDALTIPPDSRDDIGQVLAGHSRHIAWHRTTHAVTAPDIYAGSTHLDLIPLDGTLSQSTTVPPSEIRLKAVASWRQLCRDRYDLSSQINGQKTMTPDGLIADFPEAGDTLGTGFTITKASCEIAMDWRGKPLIEEVKAQRNLNGYHIDPAFVADGVLEERAYLSTLSAELEAVHLYELRRVETLNVTVPLVLQPGLVAASPDEITINLQELTDKASALAWEPLTAYAANDRVLHDESVYRAITSHTSGRAFEPTRWQLVSESEYLSSRRWSSWMLSPRGRDLQSHMLQRGRARARHASRCVTYTLDCQMPADLTLLTADTTATIHSPALIGGTATGKITEYTLRWTGGRRDAQISVACAPGLGGVDDLRETGAISSTPSGRGNLRLEIVVPGGVQKRYFEEHAFLPEKLEQGVFVGNYWVEKTFQTQLRLIPTAAPSTDLLGTISMLTMGAPHVPAGTQLQ